MTPKPRHAGQVASLRSGQCPPPWQNAHRTTGAAMLTFSAPPQTGH
ncbi:MAG: hypothetical protein AAB385_10975 [Planctomycetota bacterium]